MKDSTLSASGKAHNDAAAMSAEDRVAQGPEGVANAPDRDAYERERWLRQRFDKEHDVLLAMMRLLVVGMNSESRSMRFWRWLIDDFRSEQRLLEDANGDGRQEEALLGRLRLWLARRGGSTNGEASNAGLVERGS